VGYIQELKKGNELQSKFNNAANITDRLDEQFITLSSNKENIEILPPAKTTVKPIFKHIPVIVNTEVITNNCYNIKSPLRLISTIDSSEDQMRQISIR
jgi:hypothetical protein